MRNTRTFALTAIAVSALALGAVSFAIQPDPSPGLWQPGTCFRVFRIGEERFDLVKVLSVEGPWIRFEPDPRAPWVPGARPQARVWLNAASVSVVQEWPCSLLP